ncbi:MAG: Crp/Fnr family transcriptional regulator [Desulfovibrio sp.]
MSTELSNVKSFYKGQAIYREGQPGSTAFLIKKGTVNIYRTQNNKKQILVRLGPGELFGEMGALAGAPRTDNAEAAEFAEIMILTQQFLKNLLSQCPKTIQRLLALTTRRLREADARVSGTPAPGHGNTFLSICRLLEMADRNHAQTPAAEAKKDQHHGLGLRRSEFLRICKEILLVSQLEIDRVLEQLANLKIIELNSRQMDKAFAEKFIRLADPKTFLQVAANLQRELRDREADICALEYFDIHDLAKEVESTPEILYKKISQGEFPESLFFFDQKNTLAWAQGKGPDFFRSVKRRKKRLEELEDVNDVVHVDKNTLKDVLAKLGYYKIGVLLAVAGDEARERILGVLAKKIAKIVEEEASNRPEPDEGEAWDVQEELIGMIKGSKGAQQA